MFARNTNEQSFQQNEVQELVENWSSERYQTVSRPYSAKSIVAKRPTLKSQLPAKQQARKLFNLLKRSSYQGTSVRTFDCVDGAQAKAMSKALDVIFVSGLTARQALTSKGRPAKIDPLQTPELITRVSEIFHLQQVLDRKQRESRVKGTQTTLSNTDFLKPIIADIGSGVGGLIGNAKLVSVLVKQGAAGIQINDQAVEHEQYGSSPTNSCEKTKVLVPISEQINRINAIRIESDILDTDTVIISRTDAKQAGFITSNIDKRDHPFIMGSTNRHVRPLVTILEEAIRSGAQSEELKQIELRWLEQAGVKTFSELVIELLSAQGNADLIERFFAQTEGLSHEETKRIAEQLVGTEIYFDMESPRTNEGLYRYYGCVRAAIVRGNAYSRHTDVVSIESTHIKVHKAARFAQSLKEQCPQVILGYNLCPQVHSCPQFEEISNQLQLAQELNQLGFALQYVSLGGVQLSMLATEALAQDFATKGIYAYLESVEVQQSMRKINSYESSQSFNRVLQQVGGRRSGQSNSQTQGQQSSLKQNLSRFVQQNGFLRRQKSQSSLNGRRSEDNLTRQDYGVNTNQQQNGYSNVQDNNQYDVSHQSGKNQGRISTNNRQQEYNQNNVNQEQYGQSRVNQGRFSQDNVNQERFSQDNVNQGQYGQSSTNQGQYVQNSTNQEQFGQNSANQGQFNSQSSQFRQSGEFIKTSTGLIKSRSTENLAPQEIFPQDLFSREQRVQSGSSRSASRSSQRSQN